MFKLNQKQRKRIQKWVAALRSKKYKQTQYRLKDNVGGMCCLGVGCEVYRNAYNNNHKIKLNWNGRNYFLGSSGAMPEDVYRYFGLYNPNVEVKYKNDFISLGRLNDNEGLTFHEIANIIEREILGIKK